MLPKMKLEDYKQILAEIENLEFAECQRNPEAVIELLIKIQGMSTLISNTPQDEETGGKVPARGYALNRLCKKLRLPTSTVDRRVNDDSANELTNRVQGWYEQRIADRRANKVVWAAWFAGSAAMVSAVSALLAVLNNP